MAPGTGGSAAGAALGSAGAAAVIAAAALLRRVGRSPYSKASQEPTSKHFRTLETEEELLQAFSANTDDDRTLLEPIAHVPKDLGPLQVSAAQSSPKTGKRGLALEQDTQGLVSRPQLTLEVITGDLKGRWIRSTAETTQLTLGRDSTNDLPLGLAEVSAKHLTISWDPLKGAWTLMDMGSLNGTVLNGILVSRPGRVVGPKLRLATGDVIRLGEREDAARLTVEVGRCPAAEPVPAGEGAGVLSVVRPRGPGPAPSTAASPSHAHRADGAHTSGSESKLSRNSFSQRASKAPAASWDCADNAPPSSHFLRGPESVMSALSSISSSTTVTTVTTLAAPPSEVEGGGGLGLSYGAWEEAGSLHAMEDISFSECPLRGHPQVALFCIFDGHCGPQAAEQAKAILPKEISLRLPEQITHRGAAQVMREAFLRTDDLMEAEECGCTATAMLVWCSNTEVYCQVANVGDASAVLATTTLASRPSPASETMMADWGQRVVREVTKQHRLSNQSERERLKLAGVALHGGESRLYGLAVSRALGDKYLKGEGVPLLGKPDVCAPIPAASGAATLAILASDGLWDVTTSSRAISVALDAGTASQGDTNAMAAALGKHSRRHGSNDDVAIIVVMIGPQGCRMF